MHRTLKKARALAVSPAGDPVQVVDKLLTVSIVEKNILASSPARHHMKESAFKLDSNWAGHGPILAGEVRLMYVTRPPLALGPKAKSM